MRYKERVLSQDKLWFVFNMRIYFPSYHFSTLSLSVIIYYVFNPGFEMLSWKDPEYKSSWCVFSSVKETGIQEQLNLQEAIVRIIQVSGKFVVLQNLVSIFTSVCFFAGFQRQRGFQDCREKKCYRWERKNRQSELTSLYFVLWSMHLTGSSKDPCK